MNLWRLIACVFALLCVGMGGAALAGDPFEDAMVAVRWKDNAKALALLDTGQFAINQQNSEGYTLLHIAADQNNLEIARRLLERGADPNIKSNIGSTVADMAYSGSALLSEVIKAGGVRAKNLPHQSSARAPAPQSKASVLQNGSAATSEEPRRKMCSARHYSSSALCSDSTCKMREYRKWQTCLKTGSYY